MSYYINRKNNPTELTIKVIKVILDCRITAAHRFRIRLGFKQFDVVFTKEQSVVSKIKIPFEVENIQTQYSVLGDMIDLYFHSHKLAIELDENDHSDGNIDYEIKRLKAK